MTLLSEMVIKPNNGWMGRVNAGQILRITGRSMIDFNCFKFNNLKEYFDTARTRIYNLNLYPTAGHRLFSKQNNPMMKFITDGFSGVGKHDLQSSQGCPSLMLQTIDSLREFNEENLPDPLGLFRNINIESNGFLKPAPKEPPHPVNIDLEAEIDLICALVNCPASKLSPLPNECMVAIMEKL